MRRSISCISALFVLAACETPGGTGAVSRSATDLLEPVPIIGQGQAGSDCAIAQSAAVRLPAVVAVPDVYTGNSPDPVTTAMKAWAERIMRLTSRARVSSDAAADLKSELLAAAQGKAMQWPANWNEGEHRSSSVIYHTMETLFPAMVGYIQQKQRFTPQERAVFEAWSGDIVARLGRTSKIRGWTLDNKKYQYGALLAAQGIAAGDSRALSQSRRIHASAMRGMRDDGSLPGDSGRGGNALHYTNLAIANLVAIAELNAAAGVNLYGEPGQGDTIHSAIVFLARATQDPSLVAGYANTPGWESGSFAGYSPTRQDRRWASSEKALWGNYYLARFGDADAGRALRAVSPFLRQSRTGVHQQSGGNAECYTA